MGQITGSELKERVGVLTLARVEGEDKLVWTETRRTWAAVVQDDRRSLFSSVGVGARGVTFTLRSPPHLTLFQALKWRGMHCFLTAITDAAPGFSTVKAALVKLETVRLTPDRDRGMTFPGVLTEKYLAHRQEWPMSVNDLELVLVVPKAVQLRPGRLVECLGAAWEVLVAHELDEFKNEYEIGRRSEL